MNILCKLFWHRMYFDTSDVTGPSHCKRWKCDHKDPALEWDRFDKYIPKSDFEIFEKLKNLYAQPEDGCWPLRPCWVPDLKNPPKHVEKVLSSYTPGHCYDKIVTKFRRFTFGEFKQILEVKKE